MAAAGESTGRRILDYLNDGEELGLAEPASTPRAVVAARSLLPRFRWARLSRLGRNCGGGKGRPPVLELEEEEDEIAVEKGELKPSMGASAPSTAATAAADDDGDTRPPNPDIGVGLSLVFLLAKTSDEFRKMAQVRAEMETLMEEFKSGQARRSSSVDDDGDVSGARRDPESAASSCLTTELRVASSARLEDHAGVGFDEKSSSDDGCCSGSGKMDVLEEEFHAELERLHVNYGSGSDTPPGERDTATEWADDGDYRQGSDGGDFEGDNREDEHEDDGDKGEDDGEEEEEERNGVSAVELERRLHELLHQRHQERIEELEAALRRAERKIVEKEMEAAMWKDTARMALRRDDDDDDDDHELQ